MNKRMIIIMVMFLMISLGVGAPPAGGAGKPTAQYFTLLDEQNRIVHQTGDQVYPGDIYIAADNSRYRVTAIIAKNTARCVYQGKETMPDIADAKQAALINGTTAAVSTVKKTTIAVYHTHSDESYVPTDGKESINGNGGIYDVGKMLVDKLKNIGFKVDYSKANHNPHDINAYHRSRKTAASLLKDKPDVILDVHRDAVPASQYQTNVKGTPATKIKLVVGRSNPNMATNLNFAKRIKAVMDKKAPGLSNGIYLGKGDYNQDLSPRAMLLEIGSDTNVKQQAEKAASIFAGILPTVINATTTGTKTGGSSSTATPAAKPATAGDNSKAGMTIFIVLAIVAAAIGAFYYINRGANKNR